MKKQVMSVQKRLIDKNSFIISGSSSVIEKRIRSETKKHSHRSLRLPG